MSIILNLVSCVAASLCLVISTVNFFSVPILALLILKLYIRCSIGRYTSQRRIDGKVVVVTGANSGIGKEIARVLAARGAKVIMACRNLRTAEKVAADIRSECQGNVVVKKLDLCSFTSVRLFAQQILKEENRLDTLVNNAGISGGDFKLTEDGFDEIYQANYLGPFYLTELLLPLLKQSAPSRVINTGSLAYLLGSVSPLNFADQVVNRKYASMYRYGDSKLAMLMWTKGISDEFRQQGITINVVHPGVVSTGIAQRKFNISNLLFATNIFLFGRTAEEGAQTLLKLCLDDSGDNISGKYWIECHPEKTFKGLNNQQNAKLVEVTREILKEKR